MERGRSLFIFKVKGHISRSLDGYLGNYVVQIKLLIQAENIYVGRMLLHLVLLLFKLGCYDLYLQFIITTFAKHISDFSQTSAQVLLKFCSYMYLSKVSQVSSNHIHMTYFRIILQVLLGSYIICIIAMY